MAAIDKGSKLDAGGTTKGAERIQGRAAGAARKKHIIDQDHGAPVYRLREL